MQWTENQHRRCRRRAGQAGCAGRAAMCETHAMPAARIIARRLVGKRLPPASFDRYQAPPLTLREVGDHLAIYLYPGCVCSPEDGYESPGRDAATHRAFIYHRQDLNKLGFTPVGISSHSAELQRSAADSTGVTHPLLSDPELQIAGALGLPTFSEDAADWYCRLTLVAVSGRIVHAVYPIRRIGLSAWDVLSWLRKDGRRYTSDA
jgi:peroxiredoxin